ncbi:hypothetical protein [Acidianus manzaensis]|uniref:Uncharacterized protein n=1 Tax=Acidianus manzaensis TaxID=282676 RepID=A0A1W6JYE0_9CREN|nr:hypothetical protein [Acidianus manzaensis]ARM75331.1 hypothetical protein B6F84_04310 [Acidianus manzaensis]
MQIIKTVNSIFFSKSIPKHFFSNYFNNNDDYFVFNNVEVELSRNEKAQDFVNAISFSSDGDKSQSLQDSFLRWINNQIRLNEFVWAYQVECEIDDKVSLKNVIHLPSVLPLIGNVMLTGIIISNTKNLNMNQRKFTIIQIDNTVKIIKRDESYISLIDTINEFKKLKETLI